MSKAGETFFTSVGCMDGRVQESILKFGQEEFGARYADTITEAGLVGLLSKENVSEDLLSSIRSKIMISLEKHHSKGIIVHGHQECAGNPVDDEVQKNDIRKAAQVIRLTVLSNAEVISVFVKRAGDVWKIEEL